ncbi:uncharacterized protein KD926_003867 [Aspergillus affinis]|uniref:uncharacterized protein n=1 Tax=Aspergillus affinis TaxID=1070780 RepID=UPI0022FDCFB4|nr:uncharacterized protein KD926_003867 [Aspergillus affinis]KAI9043337.1 hypothetical protein KD926_003867 [Aspergillus affinis]
MATATAEKPKEQKPFQQQEDDYSDYDSDEYSVSGDEDDHAPQKPVQKQQQRRRQQNQQRRPADDEDDYSDDYSTDEYDDDDYEDEVQGNAMQPFKRGQQSLTNQGISSQQVQNGAMNTVDKGGEEKDDGLRLTLELNLEIEVELKAHIHGDLTLSLL